MSARPIGRPEHDASSGGEFVPQPIVVWCVCAMLPADGLVGACEDMILMVMVILVAVVVVGQ